MTHTTTFTREDIINWLLSDEVTAWLLDSLPTRSHPESLLALYSLARRLSDPGLLHAKIAKSVWVGLDRETFRVFLLFGSERENCPYSLYNHLNGIEFQPVLTAGLPKLLQRSELMHPKELWRERAARFVEVNPNPKDYFPNLD